MRAPFWFAQSSIDRLAVGHWTFVLCIYIIVMTRSALAVWLGRTEESRQPAEAPRQFWNRRAGFRRPLSYFSSGARGRGGIEMANHWYGQGFARAPRSTYNSGVRR